MRRSKKSSMGIKIILPIICVIIVIVTFVLLFDMKKKTDYKSDNNNLNTENVVANTNIVEENIVEENTITDETENNTVSNTVENTNAVQSEVVSSKDDNLSSDKQAKAAKLVAEHWGEDNSIYFTNESVASKNEYIVAVRDKATTEVKQYFRVNIETGKVKVEY